MQTEARTQTLQAFLDVQKLAGEWFDAVEAGTLTVNRQKLAELAALIQALDAVYKNLAMEYALSGRAGDDLLSGIRASLGPRRASAARRRHDGPGGGQADVTTERSGSDG